MRRTKQMGDEMVYRNMLRAALVAIACVMACDATAGDMQYDNEGSLGLMGVFGTNTNLAGRYTGLNTNGIDIVGEFACYGYPEGGSQDTWYFDAVGNNLVFQTGRGLANFGSNPANT